ncbi:MAG: hypothetical protein ACXVGE_22935 [Blastococcus sp.]
MRVVSEPIPCPVVLVEPKDGEVVLIFRTGLLSSSLLALLGRLLAHL